MSTKASDSTPVKFQYVDSMLDVVFKRWAEVSSSHTHFIDNTFHLLDLTAGSGRDEQGNDCISIRALTQFVKLLKVIKTPTIFGDRELPVKSYQLKAGIFELKGKNYYQLQTRFKELIGSIPFHTVKSQLSENVWIINLKNGEFSEYEDYLSGFTKEDRKNKMGLLTSDGYGPASTSYEVIYHFISKFHMLDAFIIYPTRQVKRCLGKAIKKGEDPKYPLLCEFIDEVKKLRKHTKKSRPTFTQLTPLFNNKQDYVGVFITRDAKFPTIKGFHKEETEEYQEILRKGS